MKTPSLVSGLTFVLASAPLALAIPAQRGPVGSAAAAPATAAICDCPAPGQGLRQGRAAGNCPATCALGAADATPLTLSAAARQALLFQIDEERMAGELYTAFGAKWGLLPFANIPKAEARHESVLRQLATRAGIALPTAVAGRFDDAEVQKRYDDLLALGLESADSALRVGAYVEEVDIADLNTLIASTDSAELQTAAKSLRTASGHHLSAFAGQLAARGITYAPQVLPAADYEAMLATGGRGRGAGSGQGQGKGWRGGRG